MENEKKETLDTKREEPTDMPAGTAGNEQKSNADGQDGVEQKHSDKNNNNTLLDTSHDPNSTETD